MRFNKADINYFFALLSSGSLLGLWFIVPFTHMALIHTSLSVKWGNIFMVLIVFIAIIITWQKNGSLSPIAISPGREKRFRIGFILTYISNITTFFVILISMLSYHSNYDLGLVIGVLIFGVILLAIPINIIGILCIETSRQRKKS